MSAARSIRLLANLFAVGVACTLAACAHPVRISPQLDMARDASRLVDARVGYRITEAQRKQEVMTPGGGGDRVSYFPYRDLEPGFYQTLASVFSMVFVVPESDIDAFVRDKQLRFVFTPSIRTSSSSSNILFWNPTDFTVSLAVTAFDAAGNQVWTRSFTGTGKAPAGGSVVETPSAQAAASEAFQQLRQALIESAEFSSRNGP